MTIELDHVTKRYAGLAAVDDVSTTIPDGAFFVVLGPSGCGKSTLLRLVAGLETLDSGTIAVLERPVSGPGLHVPPEDRDTGFVFQSYALWPHMSVVDNVAFPLQARGAGRGDARHQAAGHIETVSLTGLGDRKPAALSGGQRQRVALARCLASGAKTILMDEPLANLDPHLRATMESELAAFHKRTGATTLYITHDQREAMALADKIAVMAEGRFLQVGTPQDIYARPQSEEVARFIGRSAIVDAETVDGNQNGAAIKIGPFRPEAGFLSKGDSRTLRAVIRPGDLALAGSETPGAVQGRVVSSVYRGGSWETEIAVDGISESLPLTISDPVADGEMLGLTLARCWLLPEHPE